jgi:hypothetical protein
MTFTVCDPLAALELDEPSDVLELEPLPPEWDDDELQAATEAASAATASVAVSLFRRPDLAVVRRSSVERFMRAPPREWMPAGRLTSRAHTKAAAFQLSTE